MGHVTIAFHKIEEPQKLLEDIKEVLTGCKNVGYNHNNFYTGIYQIGDGFSAYVNVCMNPNEHMVDKEFKFPIRGSIVFLGDRDSDFENKSSLERALKSLRAEKVWKSLTTFRID